MLAAHADEIAMAVNYISDDGFIYVRKMGGIDAAITKAQRVTIHTRDGAVKGVVGNVAPHLQRGDDDKPKVPKICTICSSILVPAAAKTRRNFLRIGDPITLVDEFEILRGGFSRGARVWTTASARSRLRRRCDY